MERQAGGPGPAERYTIGQGEAALRSMRRRTLAVCAPFLPPLLRPGMRVLDVGCGAGSMTVELAGLVGPGPVVGLDAEERPLVAAGALAGERGVVVRFVRGDAYRLPFPDGSFDAVFSHALLSHLGRAPG
jgi:ubiquinone/menaquinone biosynthesis C-methylase UbiE